MQHNTCPVCRFKFEAEAAPATNAPAVGQAAPTGQQAPRHPAPETAAAAAAVAAPAGGGSAPPALSEAQLRQVQQYRRLQQQYEIATRQLRHLRRASRDRLGHLLEQGAGRAEPPQQPQQQQQGSATTVSATTASAPAVSATTAAQQGSDEPPPLLPPSPPQGAATAAQGRLPLIEMAEHLAHYQVRGVRGSWHTSWYKEGVKG